MNPAAHLRQRAEETPDVTAVVANDKQITFKELNTLVDAFAARLGGLGLHQGHVAAVQLPNSLEFVVTYFATLRLGAIFLGIDARAKQEELGSLFLDAHPALWITDPRTAAEEHPAESGCQVLPLVPHSLLETPAAHPPAPMENFPFAPEAPALYLHTSGSTGRPKIAILPARALEASSEPFEFFLKGEVRGQVLGKCIPISHYIGPLYCNTMAQYGSQMVIVEPFRPDRFLQAVARHKITLFHAVPPILASFLQCPNVGSLDLSSVQVIIPMGMAVPVALIDASKQLFPNAHILQGYGATETGGILAVPIEDEERKKGSLGKPLSPNVHVRIVDDSGHDLKPGEIGEFIVQTRGLMLGYLNRPELNNMVFRDGWYRMMDLGYQDEEGFYYFMGRKDDMINLGGEKIYPAELEQALMGHPMVKEACVLGVDDAKRGKSIVAFVSPIPGCSLEKNDLLAFLRQRLASYKVPKEFVIIQTFPRTTNGKIAKGELLALLEHGAR